jgi:zinc/manganese transport system substrate-binding protein
MPPMRVLLVLLLSMCCWAGDSMRVVTGNSVVHDLALRIGGDRISTTCLLRPGIDPHAYQPVPEDVRNLAAARLVVINGLGFEGWFEGLAKEAGFTGTVVVASAGIMPLAMAHEDHGHEHAHAAVADPHAYNSVRHGVRYAENIRDALIAADVAGAEGYHARSAILIAELRQADAWAIVQFAAIPRAQRRIVTNHDALAYFAADYGFEILSPNTALEDSQPGAQRIAALAAFIRQQGVKGVFLESGRNPKLIEQIAAEAGVRVGAQLHLDGTGAGLDYIGSFRANVAAIVEALR